VLKEVVDKLWPTCGGVGSIVRLLHPTLPSPTAMPCCLCGEATVGDKFKGKFALFIHSLLLFASFLPSVFPTLWLLKHDTSRVLSFIFLFLSREKTVFFSYAPFLPFLMFLFFYPNNLFTPMLHPCPIIDTCSINVLTSVYVLSPFLMLSAHFSCDFSVP
jgi:hypothetical protein